MPKRVIAVAPERHILRLLEVNLEKHGYEVKTALDCQETLAQIQLDLPDAVVLDMSLPFRDSVDLLQMLRKNPTTRELPVFMLSSAVKGTYPFRGWSS